MNRFFTKVFDFFSSIKLAVILILSLAVMLAIGTFYEADRGTAEAQRVIYRSWFMSLEMVLLVINLACAALDRLPWKKHHVGFVITHLGLITLILGSFITQRQGLDGTLALGINENADNFTVPNTEIHVYQNLDGKPFMLLMQKAVDFDKNPPEKNKYEYKLVDDDTLKVVRYFEKAQRKADAKESSDKTALPAMQFRLQNDRVTVNEWIGLHPALPPFYDLGPASVSIIRGPLPTPPQPRNQIVIYQETATAPWKVAIFSMRAFKPTFQGELFEKKPYDTGWMNLKFSVEKLIEHSDPQIEYVETSESTPTTTPAVLVDVMGNQKWFELDGPHEIKGPRSTYFVNFTHARVPLGFQVALKKFKMGTYAGSNLPMSYESTVSVDGKDSQVISMNEPLKHRHFTVYQTSYETNERGEPTLSIFSVNYDPGRNIKYAGALCIVLGIATMFYLKPKWTRKTKKDA